ncbi:four helix bundle protein [Sinomicrobium pectinilyticum]|uniref:Four helix bundle protein n=1 Tax=Sinomicrobium pectinilyticum TaxID=1084421 RepID=A0A3N0ESP0_SINP1|nr:four helix bundle protein [Sinomicrobium pectinilyticum]RNL90787.1 four helix bundle protein [Sinomicrobium pectinilyticum]
MASIKRFEDLEVWQLARGICKDIWNLIESTPLKNDYKLREQMNGSSGSIMDNIAEGYERDGNKEFIHFLSISKASCGELHSQLYRCLDRNHINSETFERTYDKLVLTSKKIKYFMTYLQKSNRKGSKYNYD